MRNKLLFQGLFATASVALLLRRLGRRWGATDGEVCQPLPGDALIPHPMIETTHAITIKASTAEVWPWLVQMGMDRGGWYGDPEWWDGWAEKILWSFLPSTEQTGYSLRAEPSADRIIKELQGLKVGDLMLDGPAGTAFFTVAALEENQVLALYSDSHVGYLVPSFVRDNPNVNIQGEFSWVFILSAVDTNMTRLILRTRVNYGPRLFRVLTRPFFWPIDFLLVRKMMRGIKRRVEWSERQRTERARGFVRKYSGHDEPIALGTQDE